MEASRKPTLFIKRMSVAFLLLLAAGFLGGMAHLLVMRFETGDVYPPYSSFRSDPLGTRGFFESLEALDGVTVERNLRPLDRIDPQRRATLFIVGASVFPVDEMPREMAETLDRLVEAGNRVVITLKPVNYATGRQPESCNSPSAERGSENCPGDRAEPESRGASKGESSRSPDREPAEKRQAPSEKDELGAGRREVVNISRHWGIGIAIRTKPDRRGRDVFSGAAAAEAPDLPRVISWHSAAYFQNLTQSWRVLYACEGQPVMVARAMGDGTLVLAADSFFISNEALKTERLPRLLTNLIGRHRTVIVDETHHGIRQRLGVIGYLRRHRMHWILAALLAVAGLFVWQQSMPLVPAGRREHLGPRHHAIRTRNAAEGLVHLLRRNIEAGLLLKTCYAEWEKYFAKDPRFRENARIRARRIAEQKARRRSQTTDPVSGYRAITRILSEDNQHE